MYLRTSEFALVRFTSKALIEKVITAKFCDTIQNSLDGNICNIQNIQFMDASPLSGFFVHLLIVFLWSCSCIHTCCQGLQDRLSIQFLVTNRENNLTNRPI